MYEKLRKLQDIDVNNKTVIVRTNFDVPLKDGEVLDNTRIQASVKTLEYLINQNAKIIVISHLGRPNGEINDQMSLMPTRFELGRLMNRAIKFAHIAACENSIKFMEHGEILMLENLRFDKGEESSDPAERKAYVEKLAGLADFYVNDSFGVYREHASVYELPQMLPSVAGFSIQSEIDALNYIKEKPTKPFTVIIGGAKADTKIPLLEALIEKIDTLLVGGAVAYTFLKAKGVEVGKSMVEENELKVAQKILKLAEKNNINVELPIDHIAAKDFAADSEPVYIENQAIPKSLRGMDVGTKTLEKFREVIENSKTIVWNGPMGVFEWEKFQDGTENLGQYIALSAPRDAFKVAGGSDTTMAINNLRIKAKRFNHISIGGGMMIKYIAANSEESFKILDILTGKQKIKAA